MIFVVNIIYTSDTTQPGQFHWKDGAVYKGDFWEGMMHVCPRKCPIRGSPVFFSYVAPYTLQLTGYRLRVRSVIYS
jgi:hypothetical protein